MRLYFISSNKFKIAEAKKILETKKITVEGCPIKINELQSASIEEIVTDKARIAYKKIFRPVIVEQTGLYIPEFGNLPGGLTQPFWDSLKAEKFCQFFSIGYARVTAKSFVAFCDGKNIKLFDGSISGIIVKEPRGNRDFQWDCVFQPDGYTQTFAEMGDLKNDISMRKIALEKLKEFLEDKK